MARPRITAAMCAYGRGLSEPRLSPDGTRLAYVATDAGRGQLVVVDLDGGSPDAAVTSDPPPKPARGYGCRSFHSTPGRSRPVDAAVDRPLLWVAGRRGAR